MRLEALEEGQQAAWVEVIAQGTRSLAAKTPEDYAKELRGQIEPKFRDFKVAEWEKKCSYGGLKGVEQVLHGRHKDLDAVHMRNVYLEKSEVIYYFSCVYKSGKKASLEGDIDEILRGFRCTR